MIQNPAALFLSTELGSVEVAKEDESGPTAIDCHLGVDLGPLRGNLASVTGVL